MEHLLIKWLEDISNSNNDRYKIIVAMMYQIVISQ